MTSIDKWAFSKCSNLIEVSIPDTVTSLGEYAFWYCSSLSSIVIPDSVSTIPYAAFAYCSALTEVTLPDSITSVEGSAFSDCTSLTGIDLPDSITSFGLSAFDGCTSLISVELPENLTSTSSQMFYHCTSLSYVSIPDSLTTIGYASFRDCPALTDIDFPDNLTEIGSRAFEDCTGLTQVTLPDSVESIGEYVFSGCISLTQITLSDAVASIGAYAFESCSALTEISIPESITSITQYTFIDCTSLASVTIPIGVTEISLSAFEGCSAITDVYYAGDADDWSAVTVADGNEYLTGAAFHYTYNMSRVSVAVDGDLTYTGSAVEPVMTVTYTDGSILTEGTDYIVTFENNINVGTASFTLTGTGNYTGTYTGSFIINVKSLAESSIDLEEDGYVYTGEEIVPNITVTIDDTVLENGVDYTVSCIDNIDVGTATIYITGTGNYTGTNMATFEITQKSLSTATVSFPSGITYNGSAQTIVPVVTLDGVELVKDTDFTVSYTNNIDVGTATVVINGKGNYTGSITSTFEIGAALISDADISLDYEDVTYSGSANEPGVSLTYAGTVLTEGIDYTLDYSDNVGLGTASVTISGIGNFTGQTSASFTISPIPIEDAVVTFSESTFTYDGTEKEPVITVELNGTVLEEGIDYLVFVSDNVDVGEPEVVIQGYGNYDGKIITSFTIEPQTLSSSCVSLSSYSYTYTGTTQTPYVIVTNAADEALIAGTDYSIAYSSGRILVGTYTVTVTGNGNYTGTVEQSFTITAKSLSSASVSVSVADRIYAGTAFTPAVTVTIDGTTLTEETDYTVAYSDNINAGTATVTITGIGNYTGTAEQTFTINAKSLSSASVSVADQTYTGTELTPSVTVMLDGMELTEGTDYTVAYSDNKNTGTAAVTVTGAGNYTGTAMAAFTINAKSVSEATVTLSSTSYTYDGSAKKPSVKSVVLSGTTLSSSDYSVSYSNNINKGTATVTVTGTGNYTGTTTATFTIKAKSISGATVTLSSTSYTYDGSAKKPSVKSVVLSGTTLSSSNYTVKYASGRKSIGTYNVKVTGTGNYTGTATVTFTIKPGTVKISSAASSAEKKLTVKWSKVSGSVTGYQVRYKKSTSSSWTTVTVKVSTLSKTISNLTAGKKYNVQVRAYKTVSGKKYYGSWSSTKSVTVKKAQTLTVKSSSSKTVSYSKVKKAKQTVTVITKVSGAKGTVAYSKSSGKSYFTVNSKTGKITVKKGTPKGTYTVKIKVTSAAKGTYAVASKTVTVKIKVK